MPSIKTIKSDAVKAVETVTGEATKRVEGVTSEVTKQSAAARSEAARVATDPTPLYAVVGLTDTVVERARETVTKAGKVGKGLTPKAIAKTVAAKANEATKLAESLPGKAVSDVTESLGRVQEGYQGLAQRGQGLVGRVKDQQATKDLTKQVSTVVEQGKQLLGTASKGVTDTRSAARATVTKGRRQAAGAVADVVAGEDVAVTAKGAARKPAAKKATVSKTAATVARRATKPATKAAATKSATKAAATKPATKAAATKSTTTTTTAAAKPAATKPATKAAATKSATKAAATTSATKPSTAPAAATKPATKPVAGTDTAAKRTVSTATNAATATVDAARDVVADAAKVADKAVDASATTTAKVGN